MATSRGSGSGGAGGSSTRVSLQVVRRRSREAGLGKLHPHLFRHTFAHEMLSAGMQEGDLLMLGSWRDQTMLSRNGASTAEERARDAYKRLSPGDRLR